MFALSNISLYIFLAALALDVLLIWGWRRYNRGRMQQNAIPMDLPYLGRLVVRSWKSIPRVFTARNDVGDRSGWQLLSHVRELGSHLMARLDQITVLEALRYLGGRGRWRVWVLLLAVWVAITAQHSLPPPSITIPDGSLLPHPLWKTLLFLEGPLEPFRRGVWLYLVATVLTILTFSGQAAARLPWHTLRLFSSSPTQDEKQPLSAPVFDFHSEDAGLEVRLRGPLRSWRALLIAVSLIVGALGLGGYVFFRFFKQSANNPALALWLFAMFTALLAVALYEVLKSQPGQPPVITYLWIAGALALVVASVWFLWRGKGIPGILTWLGGVLVVCIGWGLGLRSVRAGPKTSAQRPVVPYWLEGLIFLGLIGVASYFRLAHIGELAPGLNNDAAEAGRLAINYAIGKSQYTPFASIGWGFETLFIYYISGWMQLVGFNILAIRLAGITAGIITVAALYLLARRLGGPRLAWLCAALLVTSGIHITYSKVGGHRLILQPLFDVLTLYFFWRALDQRRFRDFVLAGLVLGLAVNAHNSSRANPVLYALLLLFLFLSAASRRREFLQNYVPGLLVFAACAFIAVAPIAAFAASNSTYNDRANFVFVGHRMDQMEAEHPGAYWDPVARNIVVGSLVFNQRGNGNDFFIDDPAFDYPVNILLVLGLAYALRHWRKPLPFFLLAWFFLGVFTGFLSEPNANRSLGAVVPAYIMISLFLVAAADLVVSALGDNWRMTTNVVVFVLMLSAGLRTYLDFVGPNYRYRWGYAEEATALGDYVNRIRDDHAVFMTDTYYVTDTARMMTYRPGEDPYERPYAKFNMAQALAEGFPASRPVAVVLGNWSEDIEAQHILLERYPGSRVEPIPRLVTPWEREGPVGYAVLIPVEVLNSPAQLSAGLLGKYYKGPNWEGEPYQVFVDRFMQFPEEPPYIPFSVAWEGSTHITVPGEYRFALRSTDHAWMYLDDKLILDVDNFDPQNPNERHESEAQVELTEGLHKVRITYSYESGDRQIEVFWERPEAGRERLPLEIFTPAPQ